MASDCLEFVKWIGAALMFQLSTRDAILAPLPHGLEERDNGGHGDVERIGLSCHGDAHAGVGLAQPVVAQAVLLAAHDDGEGAAQIGVGVERGGRGRGGHGADGAGVYFTAGERNK